jgi:hypothetical protein
MPMKNTLALFLFLIGLVVPLSAPAEDNGGIGGSELYGNGKFNIHPMISVTGLYDDNIYRTERDKTADFATIISPGVW